MTIGNWITILGFAITITIFLITQNKAGKKTSEETGRERGEINTRLTSIDAGIAEIKEEQKKQREDNTSMQMEISSLKESVKSAHKRIDRIEKAG